MVKKFPVRFVTNSFVVSFANCGLIPPGTDNSCVTASVRKCSERSANCDASPGGVPSPGGGGVKSEQPICGHERRPELAPVVAKGPVALVIYSSYASLKYVGSLKLSKVTMPGITS
jgi:hypothetical protein